MLRYVQESTNIAPAPFAQYGFGAQETVTDATGTRTFTYTAALQPDQEQLPAFYGNRILTRDYQGSGSGKVPGRSTGFALGVIGDLDQDYSVTYAYDNAGRLNSVTDPNGSFTYGYLANSNLRSTVTGPVHTTTTAYEAYRNVITSVENKVGSTVVSKYTYTVNEIGQRTEREQSGTAFASTSTDVFTYNTKGEITASANATIPTYDRSFAYDDIGNRTSHTDNVGTTNYTANALNQYLSIGVATPTYDADGNMTNTGTGQVYVWDAANRLIAAEPAIPVTGSKKQVNTFDYQSRRVRRAIFIYTSGAWALTADEKFIYDGWNLAAVLDAASGNALLRTYTWGVDLSGSMQGAGGVGGLLSVKDGNDIYHYTYDANGNVSEVLNNTAGIAAHYEYDAFGNTTTSNGTYASANAYRFSTKPLDGVGDLYYYGFRYYNPSTGRWLNRDSLQESSGMNLYGMVNNNPVNYWDYLGLLLTQHNGQYQVGSLPPFGPGGGQPGDTLADTGGDWPEKIATRTDVEVKVQGSLTVAVRFRQGFNPDTAHGADGLTLREHEEHHVRIHSHWWNDLKRSTDDIEGKYCNAKCTKIAENAANTLLEHNVFSAAIQNVGYDLQQYGSQLSPAAHQSLESARQRYINYVNTQRRKLDNLERQYKSADCNKM